MREFSKPEMIPTTDHGDHWRIYRGNSMRRVFSNGDLLITEPITTDTASIGDIICFVNRNGGHTVHRVVRKTAAGEVVTMGDNNASPDAEVLPPHTAVLRVTAVKTIGGITKTVHGGRLGMREFKSHRVRRILALLSSKAAGALRRLMVFKIALKDSVRFGDTEAFYFHDRFIASRDGRGRINWKSPWSRVIFRIGK